MAVSDPLDGCPIPEASTATAASVAEGDEEPGNEEDEAEEGAVEEEERREPAARLPPNVFPYSGDLSDERLAEQWRRAPETLGSIALGFADEGRLINAQPFPRDGGETWTVVSPEQCWATSETIAYVLAAARRVKALRPGAPPLRINHISGREGGYLRPHRSHQNGRDVDLGFYYPTAGPVHTRACEKVMDVALNWALVKALVTLTDVQFILVDRRVQRVLYEHALASGEDPRWLDGLFHAGPDSILQHARRHRDHFHVRFYNPRAQELGRRVAPLLAQRPEHNLVAVRVKQGDTLGALARRYHSSVQAIQKASHLKGTFLRLGQVLSVPLRGPCTRCPVPAPLVLPPRRLAPGLAAIATATTAVTAPSSLGTSPRPGPLR